MRRVTNLNYIQPGDLGSNVTLLKDLAASISRMPEAWSTHLFSTKRGEALKYLLERSFEELDGNEELLEVLSAKGSHILSDWAFESRMAMCRRAERNSKRRDASLIMGKPRATPGKKSGAYLITTGDWILLMAGSWEQIDKQEIYLAVRWIEQLEFYYKVDCFTAIPFVQDSYLINCIEEAFYLSPRLWNVLKCRESTYSPKLSGQNLITPESVASARAYRVLDFASCVAYEDQD